MSRPALLAAYEKLSGLLDKLPGSLQEPIMRELDPIKEIFLRQRAPRLAILGDPGIGLPALVNALAARSVLHAPLMRGPWTAARGAGNVELVDLRGSGTLSGARPIFIYLLARHRLNWRPKRVGLRRSWLPRRQAKAAVPRGWLFWFWATRRTWLP